MRLPRWSVAVLGVLGAAGVVLRAASTSPLWLDEALTVEIARLPVGALLDALRNDGAPPLYYLLLHAWMEVFGTGDLAARSLSAVFSVVTIPLVALAARRRGGATMALAAASLAATSPFAIRYATEARMYALVALLAVVGWLLVERSLRTGHLPATVGVGAVAGLLLLTHYWSFYLLAAVVGVGVVAHGRTPALRPRLRQLGASIAVGATLIFAPWVPSFAFQMAHTGTPWGTSPGPVEVAFTTLVDLGGGPHPEGQVIAALIVGLGTLALTGRSIDERRIELDLRSVPGVRTEAVVAAVTMLAGVAVGMLTASAWASRYNSVVFGLVVLVAAAGVRAITGRGLLAGLLILASALGIVGGVRNFLTPRTQAEATAASIVGAGADDGDWVVYCPDQLAPDVQRELPSDLGLVQVTFPELASPRLVNWVDYAARVDEADPLAFAEEVLEGAGEEEIFYVWMSGYRTHGTKCEQLNNALAGASSGSRQLQTPDPDIFERQIVWLHPQRAGRP